MIAYVSLLIIALAVSLDSGSVGLLYGARKIRIPWTSVLIISVCSGVVIWCSMRLGHSFMGWLHPETGKVIGAVILVCVGIWALIQFFLQNRNQQIQEVDIPQVKIIPARTLLRIEMRKLGLVIQILKSPAIADMDRSGNITSWEASLLGIALSLDSLGAGIGAAMVGYSPIPTAIVISISSGLFISIGLCVGRWLSEKRWIKRISILPGLFLIALGIMKLL